jgi:hypothetical protein
LPGLTPAQFDQVARDTLAAWSLPRIGCTSLNLSWVRASGEPEAAFDSVNSIVVRRDRFCNQDLCYDPAALAITTTTVSRTGGIRDADIEINAANFQWAILDGSRVNGGQHDLESVLLHETGHFIGLDHNCANGPGPAPIDHQGMMAPSCIGASAEVRAAVMFPSDSPGQVAPLRALTADEARAACALYPIGDQDAGTSVADQDASPPDDSGLDAGVSVDLPGDLGRVPPGEAGDPTKSDHGAGCQCRLGPSQGAASGEAVLPVAALLIVFAGRCRRSRHRLRG